MKIHYHLHSNEYEDWRLWIWQERKGDGKKLAKELKQERIDTFGAVFELKNDNKHKWLQFEELGFKPKQGEWLNDTGIDYGLSKPSSKKEVWIVQGDSNIYQQCPGKDVLARAEKIFNQRKGESEMSATQAGGKKNESKKEEEHVGGAKSSEQDTPESLQLELKEAEASLNRYEERIRNLKTKENVAGAVRPGADYNFVKHIIGTDIRMLDEAYKGLRELVLSIQDRLEALNCELSEKQKLQEKASEEKVKEVDVRLNERVNSVQAEANNKANAIEANFNTSLQGVKGELSNTVEGVRAEITQTVNTRFTQEVATLNNNIEGRTRSLKNEHDQTLKVLAQYILKLAEATEQSNSLSKYGLDNAMKKIESSGSSM